jgi:hypothetical protein
MSRFTCRIATSFLLWAHHCQASHWVGFCFCQAWWSGSFSGMKISLIQIWSRGACGYHLQFYLEKQPNCFKAPWLSTMASWQLRLQFIFGGNRGVGKLIVYWATFGISFWVFKPVPTAVLRELFQINAGRNFLKFQTII